MNKIIIGIDPDIDKSGVAIKSHNSINLRNLKFFELYDLLNTCYKYEDVCIYIEAGWLNKSNWHTSSNNSVAVNTRIGNKTGANHEVGRKIVEMCEYLCIKHVLIKPTNSKIKSDLFKRISGITTRTNQEQRDAYMLIHGIKIKEV